MTRSKNVVFIFHHLHSIFIFRELRLLFRYNYSNVYSLDLAISNLKRMLLLTWHTNAAESSSFVYAGSFILARAWLTLIDVLFTTAAFESCLTVTLVGARCIHADTPMLTRRTLTNIKMYMYNYLDLQQFMANKSICRLIWDYIKWNCHIPVSYLPRTHWYLHCSYVLCIQLGIDTYMSHLWHLFHRWHSELDTG